MLGLRLYAWSPFTLPISTICNANDYVTQRLHVGHGVVFSAFSLFSSSPSIGVPPPPPSLSLSISLSPSFPLYLSVLCICIGGHLKRHQSVCVRRRRVTQLTGMVTAGQRSLVVVDATHSSMLLGIWSEGFCPRFTDLLSQIHRSLMTKTLLKLFYLCSLSYFTLSQS